MKNVNMRSLNYNNNNIRKDTFDTAEARIDTASLDVDSLIEIVVAELESKLKLRQQNWANKIGKYLNVVELTFFVFLLLVLDCSAFISNQAPSNDLKV